jgi:hypothetical protein
MSQSVAVSKGGREGVRIAGNVLVGRVRRR